MKLSLFCGLIKFSLSIVHSLAQSTSQSTTQLTTQSTTPSTTQYTTQPTTQCIAQNNNHFIIQSTDKYLIHSNILLISLFLTNATNNLITTQFILSLQINSVYSCLPCSLFSIVFFLIQGLLKGANYTFCNPP